MARPMKPIDIILQEKKYRMKPDDIARRKSAEIRIGIDKLRPPSDIKNNPIAKRKFEDLIKIFDGCAYISSSDLDILAEYCKVYAEIIQYEAQMKDIAITDDQFLKLDSRLDRKRDLLIKLQDRIFLNPSAKLKNIPIQEEEKEPTPMENFLNNRWSKRDDEVMARLKEENEQQLGRK